MRRLAVLSALSLLGSVGCDSSDPLQQGPVDFAFRVEAIEAPMKSVQIWDVYFDENRDGIPDDTNDNGTFGDAGDISIWCEATPETVVELIPWRFSVLIRLVRNGEVVTQTCIDSPQLARNLTVYSHTERASSQSLPSDLPSSLVPVPGTDPPEFTFSQGEVFNRFRIDNPRIVSWVNPIASRAPLNFIAIALLSTAGGCPALTRDPGLPAFGVGPTLCGQTDTGPEGERLQPFEISLESGDTISVDLRRADSFNELQLPLNTQPPLTGIVTIDGEPAAGIVGTTRTSSAPGASFSFFYTRR